MSTHLRCTVESMNYSACGMVPGDHFDVIDGNLSIPNGRPFCYFAIANVIPLLSGRLDSPAGEDWLATEPLLACPDPPEALYMRLKRVLGTDAPTTRLPTMEHRANPDSKAEKTHD